jgi:hypothetical protein
MNCLNVPFVEAQHQLNVATSKTHLSVSDANPGNPTTIDSIVRIQNSAETLLKEIENCRPTETQHSEAQKIDTLRELESSLLSMNGSIARTADEISGALFAYYCKLRTD